jgi:hypothetical protein
MSGLISCLIRRPHPDKNELHLLPVGILESANYPGLPTNFNHYLARAIDMDVVCSNQIAFAYVKVCQLIVVGFIENPYTREWQGTRVAIKQGTIGHQKRYILPQKFGVYLTDQARRMARLYSGISPKQLAKVEEAFRLNAERASKSEGTRAVEADMRMFGQAVFDEEQ